MNSLLNDVRKCTLCSEYLPFDPKPILHFSKSAKVLIVGQAPGVKAHTSGIPWNDASGDRLREWFGVSREQFYDESIFAIVPMGFCYPGKGKSGDLPPRPECSAKWMSPILDYLGQIQLKVLIGAYSQEYFLKIRSGQLTKTVKNWKKFGPDVFPLPHPSPRNNIWLKKNPWFQRDLLPKLKKSMHKIVFECIA